MNDVLAEQHALGACQRAKEELAALSQEKGVRRLDHGALRWVDKVTHTNIVHMDRGFSWYFQL